jgi:hypothetical protein
MKIHRSTFRHVSTPDGFLRLKAFEQFKRTRAGRSYMAWLKSGDKANLTVQQIYVAGFNAGLRSAAGENGGSR